METTKNKLPENIQKFMNKLKKYIDIPIYYYGSVQRYDYFLNKSDIDICLFTDNLQTLINQLHHFLHLKKEKFKKIFWKYDNKLISGYKTFYVNEKLNLKLEISIYNKKYKKSVLKDINYPINNLPFYIIIMLIILKILAYNLNLLPYPIYRTCKNNLLNYILNKLDSNYTILPYDL